MLTEVAIFIHQLRHLFLQPVILLHQKLVHSRQLPIYSLQPGGLFSLLLPTSELTAKNRIHHHHH